jgi:hypothetical protein
LSDEEYKHNTLSLINYANDGYYILPEYLSVMHYAERLNNILNLDLDSVCNELIHGLGKHIDALPLKGNLLFSQFEMSGKSSPLSPFNKRLYEAGMEKIQLFKNKIFKNEVETFVNLFTNNIDDFQNKYYNDKDFKRNIYFYPFLNYISPETFIELITNSSGQTLIFLKDFLKDRFEKFSILKEETDKVKEIAILFSKYRNENAEKGLTKIKSYLINELAEAMIEVSKKPHTVLANDEII